MSTVIEILNLKCQGCVNTIKKDVLSVEGITKVKVDLESSKVIVNTDNEDLILSVKKKLSSLGYPETGNSNTMLHKAKSFISCASGRIVNIE